MYSFFIVFLASFAVLALERCRTDRPEVYARRSEYTQQLADVVEIPSTVYEIRVIVHLMMNGTNGFVALDAIDAQMNATNAVLSGKTGNIPDTNIRVVLNGMTYTDNATLFYGCEDYNTESDMRFYTAISSATTLNVWSCYSDDILGFVAFLPNELTQWSIWNGISMNFRAFPNTTQTYEEFDLGHTFTHEFGHYLGLLHTFGNGVDGCVYGDDIPDTPPEKTPAYGAPCLSEPPRKTCPGTPGVDPVSNMMDYTDDICTNKFSADQVSLMRKTVRRYRPITQSREPFRCVTTAMTVCKSMCYTDRLTPHGLDPPASGWCRTDEFGNYGTCCCGNSCFAPMIRPPTEVLACGNVQAREGIFQSDNTTTPQCLAADIGGTQLFLSPCSDSPFVRWALDEQGFVESIGTGWCLTRTGEESGGGKSVGLRPCGENYLAIQNWTLPLSLDDGMTTFLYKTNPECNTLRTKRNCRASQSLLGCGCRWYKNACISGV